MDYIPKPGADSNSSQYSVRRFRYGKQFSLTKISLRSERPLFRNCFSDGSNSKGGVFRRERLNTSSFLQFLTLKAVSVSLAETVKGKTEVKNGFGCYFRTN